jgi:hypothetical protein
MERVSVSEFQQSGGDWRTLGAGVSAWFDAPSHVAGAALIGRIAELTDPELADPEPTRVEPAALPDLELRSSGVRIRIGAPGSADLSRAEVELTGAISAAARELGLDSDPAALQSLRLAVGATDPDPLLPFWRTLLDYQPVGVSGLGDPLRRDPAISFHRLERPRPLRSRIHVDVVRIPDAVTAARTAVGQQPFGVNGLTLADADGNEFDLVPGDRLTEGPETADWRTLFGAMTFYPVASPRRASELAAAVAGLADDAGIPLLIDLRPDGVMIDSGKDQWEDEPGFATLAARIQTAARELGHTADVTRPRFVQFGVDAVDVTAVREFWISVLGYRPDPRSFLTDIYDPRRLDPVLFFQDLDVAEEDRLRQPDRLHFELTVPRDQLRARLDAATGAGGRMVAESRDSYTVADPDGNELKIVTHP